MQQFDRRAGLLVHLEVILSVLNGLYSVYHQARDAAFFGLLQPLQELEVPVGLDCGDPSYRLMGSTLAFLECMCVCYRQS